MSDLSRGVLALLLSAAAASGASPDAAALLARAERPRDAFPEGVVTIRVTVTGAAPGRPDPAPARFEVAVKGRRSRVKFLEPGDEGKYVVWSGGGAWLLLPTAKNPIGIPASYRVRGGLSSADVAQAGFGADYDAVLEREDELAGMTCAVLRLTAKKGLPVPYPVVRVWIDRKDGLYRKAVFLLTSGKTAKEATFDIWATERGATVLKRMTIADALRPGTTVVEYLDWSKRPVPDRRLDPATARQE